MTEIVGNSGAEVPAPNEADMEWISRFNEQYANKGFTATVTVQDWLEQPVGEIGSAYYELKDAMSGDGWWQTISGKVYNAGYTNIPHYHDTGFANVLALTDASLQQPDGSSHLLAEGRLVLVRLDRLKAGVSLTPPQE
jgi:hypothetical protein